IRWACTEYSSIVTYSFRKGTISTGRRAIRVKSEDIHRLRRAATQSLQERRQVTSKLSLLVAAEIVYAVNAYDFRQYCFQPTATPAKLLNWARQRTRHLVASWT